MSNIEQIEEKKAGFSGLPFPLLKQLVSKLSFTNYYEKFRQAGKWFEKLFLDTHPAPDKPVLLGTRCILKSKRVKMIYKNISSEESWHFFITKVLHAGRVVEIHSISSTHEKPIKMTVDSSELFLFALVSCNINPAQTYVIKEHDNKLMPCKVEATLLIGSIVEHYGFIHTSYFSKLKKCKDIFDANAWCDSIRRLTPGCSIRFSEPLDVSPYTILKCSFYDKEHTESYPRWMPESSKAKPFTMVVERFTDNTIVNTEVESFPMEYISAFIKDMPYPGFTKGRNFIVAGQYVIPMVKGYPIYQCLRAHGLSYSVYPVKCPVLYKGEDKTSKILHFTVDTDVKIFNNLNEAHEWKIKHMQSIKEKLEIVQPGDVIVPFYDHWLTKSKNADRCFYIYRMKKQEDGKPIFYLLSGASLTPIGQDDFCDIIISQEVESTYIPYESTVTGQIITDKYAVLKKGHYSRLHINRRATSVTGHVTRVLNDALVIDNQLELLEGLSIIDGYFGDVNTIRTKRKSDQEIISDMEKKMIKPHSCGWHSECVSLLTSPQQH